MRWMLLILVAVAMAISCDMAKDTADTSQQGGAGAVGIAEKMKSGTVGEADMDSGESSEADSTQAEDSGD